MAISTLRNTNLIFSHSLKIMKFKKEDEFRSWMNVKKKKKNTPFRNFTSSGLRFLSTKWIVNILWCEEPQNNLRFLVVHLLTRKKFHRYRSCLKSNPNATKLILGTARLLEVLLAERETRSSPARSRFVSAEQELIYSNEFFFCFF